MPWTRTVSHGECARETDHEPDPLLGRIRSGNYAVDREAAGCPELITLRVG